MKVKTKNVYYCDHCNKHYLQKAACEKHEIICFSNPANDRDCLHCHFLEKADVTVYEDACYPNGNHEEQRVISILKCTKLNFFVYPPVIELKGNAFLEEDLDCKNIPMLKKCKYVSNN